MILIMLKFHRFGYSYFFFFMSSIQISIKEANDIKENHWPGRKESVGV